MRQTTGIILLEGLTGLVFLIGLGFGLLAWRLISGPTDLAFVKSDIERALTEARGGKQVEIDTVSLRWQTESNEFQVYAEGLKFYSNAMEPELVASSKSAVIDVRAVGLLKGQIELKEVQIIEGELLLLRDDAGVIWIAGERIPVVRPVQFHEASSPIQYVEQSLLNIVDNIAESAALADLRRIELTDFQVRLVDQGFDVDWTLDGADLSLTREGDRVEIGAEGDAYGNGAPERVTFELNFEPESRRIESSLRLDQINVFDLPLPDALTEAVEGRLTADLAFVFGAQSSGIDILSVDILAESGELRFGEDRLTLGRNDLGILIRLEDNTALLDGREVNIGPVSGDAAVTINDVVGLFEAASYEPTNVSIVSESLRFDLRPYFVAAQTVENMGLQGQIDFGRQQLNFSRLNVTVDQTQATAQGRIYYNASRPHPKDLPFGVALTGQSEGIVKTQTVLDFWPPSLGRDARNWVIENLKSGDAFDASIKLDLPPTAFRTGYLENETLQVDFSFENGSVMILDDMPSVINASGSARLKGNSFEVDVGSGSFAGWTLTSGNVSMPYFVPKGENMTVEAEGYGDVTQMIRAISDSRLQLEADYGLPVDKITGQGKAQFRLVRPMLSDVSYEDSRFSVSAQVEDGQFVDVINDMTLTSDAVNVSVTNDVIRIWGYGELDDAPVEFDWRDQFTSEAPDKTRLLASGYVSPDLLNRFGVAARTYMTGEALAEVEATGPTADDYSIVSVDLDLQNTRLDLPELNWDKPVGEPASVNLVYRRDTGNNLTRVVFNSDGVEFRGNVALNETGRLDRLSVDRFFLEDQMDLSGDLRRTSDVALVLDVQGPFLNAEPLLDGMLGGGGQEGALPLFGNIEFDAEIDRLRLKSGLEVEGAQLKTQFNGPLLETLELSGAFGLSEEFSLDIRGNDAGDRVIVASASDAGSVFSALIGQDIVEDGSLSMTGILRSGDEPTELYIVLNEARMRDAPLLTQVLSLASLRGLADVMSGEGVLFSTVEVPLVIDNSGYYVSGAKASGPALGLTANGSIQNGGEQLTIDGVLVPSFGMNSALGGIPIIGDLFVSREGEGVFAMTYSVRGSLEEARVAVNPLSGILPGVLRRIFENPASEEVPEPTAPAN